MRLKAMISEYCGNFVREDSSFVDHGLCLMIYRETDGYSSIALCHASPGTDDIKYLYQAKLVQINPMLRITDVTHSRNQYFYLNRGSLPVSRKRIRAVRIW